MKPVLVWAAVMVLLGIGAFLTEKGDEPWNWIFTIPWMFGWIIAVVWLVRRWFQQQRRIDDWLDEEEEKGELLEMGPDPLDPRGDGTLQPGDPLFDLIMQQVESGENGGVFIANRVDDDGGPGVWEVKSRNMTEDEKQAMEEAIAEEEDDEGPYHV